MIWLHGKSKRTTNIKMINSVSNHEAFGKINNIIRVVWIKNEVIYESSFSKLYVDWRTNEQLLICLTIIDNVENN